jgi:hypothetical protein
MRQESIREVTQQGRRGAMARRAPIIFALVALFAGWTAHGAVRLTDWRSSVAAAHRGARSQDRDLQLQSIVALHNAAREAIESLRAAEACGGADVQGSARESLQHLAQRLR